MNKKYNPYYQPEKLGLEILTEFEAGGSYEFDTLLFFKAPNGQIYSVADSGCSCPIPFEDYEGSTWEEAVSDMIEISSYSAALAEFEKWNNRWRRTRVNPSDGNVLKEFFEE